MWAFALGQGHPAEDECVDQARNDVDREFLFTGPSYASERSSMMSAAIYALLFDVLVQQSTPLHRSGMSGSAN
jgi:hypothetical protein